MRIIHVMDGVTTNVASAIQNIVGANGVATYNVHVFGTGTFSVIIEGSYDGTNFFTLDTMAANEIASVLACPYMRATTSGMSGAVLDVFLGVF